MSGDEPLGSDEPSGEEQTSQEDSVPTSKQRRATAKRKLERQLERRTKQARRRRILTIAGLSGVIVLVAGLVVWTFVFDKDSKSAPTAADTATSAPPTQDALAAESGVLPPFRPPAGLGANCQYPASPQPAAKPANPPRTGKVPTDEVQTSMSITTSQGPLGVMLANAQAPCTVNSFASLAQQGWFNGTTCHRLTTGPSVFVLQCGAARADGTGGPGYQFADEYPTNQYLPDDPRLTEPVIYPRGTLAMANAGPDTNSSQFFIVYKDSQLPPKYTVFGKVDEKDMAVVDKIAAAGTVDGSPDGKPKMDVEITSARVD